MTFVSTSQFNIFLPRAEGECLFSIVSFNQEIRDCEIFTKLHLAFV